jgi:hypothetical protein
LTRKPDSAVFHGRDARIAVQAKGLAEMFGMVTEGLIHLRDGELEKLLDDLDAALQRSVGAKRDRPAVGRGDAGANEPDPASTVRNSPSAAAVPSLAETWDSSAAVMDRGMRSRQLSFAAVEPHAAMDVSCYVAFGNDNISCCLRRHDEEFGGHISLFPSL